MKIWVKPKRWWSPKDRKKAREMEKLLTWACKQENIEPRFQKVINDNFWDLF